MGGMIGEATLAMLYVPLFFYLFDRLSERSAKRKEKSTAGEAKPDAAPGPNNSGDTSPDAEGGH